MNNSVKEFEAKYQSDEQELIVLMKEDISGACVEGNYYFLNETFIGYVDLQTGEFHNKKGMLEWIVDKNEDLECKWKFSLKGMVVYRVRVRKIKDKEIMPNADEQYRNRYMLVEILETDIYYDKLDEIRQEYIKPVQIEDELLGKFVLDREFSWFEGKINWCGEECSVYLGTDEDEGDTAVNSFEAFRKLAANMQEWDSRIRAFASEQLLESANEWQSDSDEEAEPITAEVFKKRMEAGEISVDGEGDIEFTFYDDDMFWGHYIVVYANISGEITAAAIEG